MIKHLQIIAAVIIISPAPCASLAMAALKTFASSQAKTASSFWHHVAVWALCRHIKSI